MRDLFRARLGQPPSPVNMPPDDAGLPERFRGRLTFATTPVAGGRLLPVIDLGATVFAPEEALDGQVFSRDYRMAATTRDALVTDGTEFDLALALDARMKSLLGRSLRLRS